MKFRNVSPLGDLDIPAVGLVPAGEEFDLPADLAPFFAGQVENYQPVDGEAEAAQIAALAEYEPVVVIGEAGPEPVVPVEQVKAEKKGR